MPLPYARSNKEKEWSHLLQHNVFIHKYNLLQYAIVCDMGSEIIEIEWFSNLVSEFSWCWHCLDIKSHGGSSFDISECEVPSAHWSICVEESPNCILVLGELVWIWVSTVILKVVVEDMDSLLAELFGDFSVAPDHISEICFLHIWVSSSVTKTCIKNGPWEYCQHFKSKAQVPALLEHQWGTRKYV